MVVFLDSPGAGAAFRMLAYGLFSMDRKTYALGEQ